jgi:hypothetical protein
MAMSNLINSRIHLFLVQPISKINHKEMIVYADNEQQARNAAALANNSEKSQVAANTIPAESIYLDSGMSICIEIKPDIIKAENDSEYVRVKYNEVIYDLKMGVAQKVIAENIL